MRALAELGLRMEAFQGQRGFPLAMVMGFAAAAAAAAAADSDDADGNDATDDLMMMLLSLLVVPTVIAHSIIFPIPSDGIF